jgi:hypothetical protein
LSERESLFLYKNTALAVFYGKGGEVILVFYFSVGADDGKV